MNETDTYPIGDDAYQQLVAYLDGELDVESSRQVELRLAEDAEFRGELLKLQQTWDLLDELPPVEVDEAFTHTTVQMIAVSAENELGSARQRHRRTRWLAWSLAGTLLLAVTAGSYLVTTHLLARPNERLVSDFPVIQNYEVYRVADSVEFLEQLDRRGLFDEEVDNDL
jgi:anti-sigma factor RsiW